MKYIYIIKLSIRLFTPKLFFQSIKTLLRSLVFVFLSLLFKTVSCQDNFSFGYILKNDGDTLFGLIESSRIKKNFHKCIIKTNELHKTSTYSPNDIKEFRINDGNYYVSKIINTKEFNDTIFLEYLISGKLNIFYYYDENGNHYFIQKGQDCLIQLNNPEKVIKKQDGNYIVESKRHLGILKYALNDCKEIQPNLGNVALNHESLIELATDYHNYTCTAGEKCTRYSKKRKKLLFDFGLFASSNITNSEILYSNDRGDVTFNNSRINNLGILMNISDPNYINYFSLQPEIKYSKIHISNHVSSSFEALSISCAVKVVYSYKYDNYITKAFCGFQRLWLNSIKSNNIPRNYIPYLGINPSYAYTFGIGLDYTVMNIGKLFFDIEYQIYKFEFGSYLNVLPINTLMICLGIKL